MFDIFYSGVKPGLFTHEREADSIEHAQKLSRTRYFWWVSYLCDYSNWNWNWEPPPWQGQYTHVWPSNHHDYSGTYLVPKHGDIQYHFQTQKISLRHRPQDFSVLVDAVQFDYSWAPHPHDPPYHYVFGNQWYQAEQWPTVKFIVPGASQTKYMTEPIALLPERHDNRWHTLIDCKWDYSWQPDPGDPPYIYVFGNQWHAAEIMPTVEYHVPGANQRKYMTSPTAILLPDMTCWSVPAGIDPNSIDYSWVPDPGSPPYIYQFATQHQKTGGPVYTVPGATEVTYVSRPYAIKTTVDDCWTVPQGIDIESFDWTWHPDNTEPPYIYQFASQHQKTGGPTYTVPGATEIKYLEHIEVQVGDKTVPIVEIDHLDGHAGQIANTVKTVRYFDNYRDTLLRIARNLKGQHEWVWICSSICDYSNFDFSWHPEQWQSTMLHVFASNEQKFGDTFYMHVPTFAERAENKALLEWYAVNFVPKISVPRRPMPVIVHHQDSHVAAVQQSDFAGPLVTFTNHDYVTGDLVTVPLWREQTKTIVPVSSGAGTVIVPKTAVPYIKTQLYDYPHIDKTQRRLLDTPLDIVFISNGEINAEQNYMALLKSCASHPNTIHRVKNVNGRVAAYHASAQISATPWFFAVFAKLEVAEHFDWSWQPDRMQQPKHYIFHARNPINGLEYGHQAMIAYNKQLVLENSGVGLDFTLDQPHQTVPILSGTAYYANSKWMAWRTAFREVIKLRASLPDVESEYRLNRWLSSGSKDDISPYSQYGAEDAVEYYNSVNGDFVELRKSYEWSWLASYAFMKRSLTTDQ